MAEPLVDILMATYNGERFVAEQIESIQAQTYENWRLLVSDDCSSDGTLAIVGRYAADDDRIHIVSEGVRHGGAKENFFALMAMSDAPYCMFCDQDDVWLPEKVEKSLAALRELEDVHGADVPLLVFCDMKVVDEELNIIHESFEGSSNFDPSRLTFSQLVALNVAAGCCQCFNHELLARSISVSDIDAVEFHDWWSMLVAAAFGAISFINESLSLYRQHSENEVGANDYSPADRVRNQGFMEEQFRAAVTQAELFAKTFGEQMNSSDCCAINELVEALDSKTFLGGRSSSEEPLLEAWSAEARATCHGGSNLRRESCIWGGIVTYNPDIERLRENVNAIAPQVEQLVIFDNGSENCTDIERVFSSTVQIIKSAENLGMAKALNRLAETAEQCGASDIVLLDQDSVAAVGLVAEEVKHRSDRVGVVCCLVVDRNHEDEAIGTDEVCEVKRPITSGSMVNLTAWRCVGGYDERLFVDWVDCEFADNLRTHGFRLVKTPNTTILHEMGRQEYAWNAPGRNDMGEKQASKGYYRQNYPTWRWRDRARSQTITIRKYGWSRIGWEERYYFLRATVGRILLLEQNKIESLKAVIDGCKSGADAFAVWE